MWVATQDLPGSAAHPFYRRLNQILDQHDFDGYVEGLCERFYADDGRPGLPPGRYFRLLLIGYFEGLDAERAIAWRAADSFALREFIGLVLPLSTRSCDARLARCPQHMWRPPGPRRMSVKANRHEIQPAAAR